MEGFDPFRTLSPCERTRQLAAHLTLVRDRDGEIDLERAQLPRRESFFREVDASPVRWCGPFDRKTFEHGLAESPGPGVDPRVLFALAAAKANEGESYGVEFELQRFAARNYAGVDRQLLHVAMEDRDHTRILARVCAVFGIDLELRPPSLPTRAVTRAMNHLPAAMRFPLILCGEVVGAVFFRILLERCDLFREQPEVEERLRLLIGEIVTDETGHVSFCRSRVSPPLLRAARALLPGVARVLLKDLSEFARLAGGVDEVHRRLRGPLPVPEPVTWLQGELA